MFEGEYLNGKRNGKWKEYNLDGEIIFEGEYKDDKKWNGKGYDEDGNVIYEINNGNGKIKEYNNYGKLIFEGEYAKGKRNGFGKEYRFGELIFEGDYCNGQRWNGKGKEYHLNGRLNFEGKYLNGKKTDNNCQIFY